MMKCPYCDFKIQSYSKDRVKKTAFEINMITKHGIDEHHQAFTFRFENGNMVVFKEEMNYIYESVKEELK